MFETTNQVMSEYSLLTWSIPWEWIPEKSGRSSQVPKTGDETFKSKLRIILEWNIQTIYIYIYILVRGFNLSEKYESQIGSSSQLLGKIKKNPNHQPYVYIYIYQHRCRAHGLSRRNAVLQTSDSWIA